jgi:hypothetical protein
VFIVDKFGMSVLLKPLNMARETAFMGDISGSFCNVYVALIAGYTKLQI